MALKALHDSFGIEDVIMSSYQAMSGAGKDAVEELLNLSCQVVESYDKSREKMSFHRNYASGLKAKAQPRVSAFNLFPQIGPLDNLGWSDEEQKIMKETRKILNLVDLSVTATAVRTPVINGHSQSVAVTLTKSASVSEVQDALAKAPLCRVVRDPQAYPTPAEVTGTDDVVIGKVRQDESRERRFHFWVVADNLRVKATLNAYRIMEKILS
jgi:aspartate-semialdehyde dehydrogenase